MPRRSVALPSSPKITVNCGGNTVTVTDGIHTRLSSCASPVSARSLATRLKNDLDFARRWMRVKEPEQLPLPLDIARQVVGKPASGSAQTMVSGGLIVEP